MLVVPWTVTRNLNVLLPATSLLCTSRSHSSDDRKSSRTKARIAGVPNAFREMLVREYSTEESWSVSGNSTSTLLLVASYTSCLARRCVIATKFYRLGFLSAMYIYLKTMSVCAQQKYQRKFHIFPKTRKKILSIDWNIGSRELLFICSSCWLYSFISLRAF